MLEAVLKIVQSGGDLSMEEMDQAIGWIMDGRVAPDQIARLLTALYRKGETVSEVAGAAAALRRHMTPIRTSRPDVIDVVGTGGDASGTFNISTAAALVTAAAGQPVAKHGNRRFTSRSGSADVLAELGVNIEAGVATVEACLDELGICFCFAPLLHQAMKYVAPVRRSLGHPTIFNILGPLANPASAPFQLLGVARPELRALLAEALLRLGTRRTLVVHGEDGLDEVTLAGRTWVTEASADGLHQFHWRPQDFGLRVAGRDQMLVEGPADSAQIIRQVLAGRPGPPRDIVLANAAAALWTAGKHPSLDKCQQLAAEAIDSGAARDLLDRLVKRTCSA